MRIGSKEVGEGQPVYIAAEVGCNHSGSLAKAMHQMSLAAKAGADAVKLQVRTPEVCVPADQQAEMRDTPWGEMSYLDYRRKLEFDVDDYRLIADHAREISVDWFASVWDIPSLDRIMPLAPAAIKISSPSVTDLDLIDAVAASGIPVVLSTGMSTPKEIVAALSRLPAASVVCHCTSIYPLPAEKVNLRCIPKLAKSLHKDAVVGYSGHEEGLAISIAAVALGAKYLERHFTDDRTQWGSDQAFSMQPENLEALVRTVRNVESALGDGKKKVYPEEKAKMKSLRRV